MKASDTRSLPRTGQPVSLLGFGGTAIGNLYTAKTDDEAQAALQAAWDAGVRYFDTAPLYGLTLSELRMARFFADLPREAFTLSTKVGRTLEGDGQGRQSRGQVYIDVPVYTTGFGYTRDDILRSFEGSVARLGLERIDILYLHDLTPMNHGSQEVYEGHFRDFFDKGGHDAMIELRREGRVGAIGIGVGSSEAAQRLVEHGDFDACLLAGRYTLLEQDALTSLLPLCEAGGVGVVIGGPYNSGILATGAKPGATYNYREAPPEILDRVRRIEAVCAAHATPLIAAALQFPLHHPSVVSTIPGAGSVTEVRAAVDTIAQPVPPALYADLKAQGLLRADAPIG